jgi:thioredoxin-related protein
MQLVSTTLLETLTVCRLRSLAMVAVMKEQLATPLRATPAAEGKQQQQQASDSMKKIQLLNFQLTTKTTRRKVLIIFVMEICIYCVGLHEQAA